MRATFTARGARFITDVRPSPSVPVRCIQVDAADHLFLAGRSFIPTHNSTLGLDIARSAAIKHHQATCIFSLEMSKHEITMRLLSAEAKVPLHHMRAGSLSDEDWSKLARRMGEVADAPLYIDDSPEHDDDGDPGQGAAAQAAQRPEARRHRLPAADDVREKGREPSAGSVGVLPALKLLAKELEVPVIAMSQLNRGSEQRQDKKPMLSDLRESGCLTADTRILRADTGAETTMGELFDSGRDGRAGVVAGRQPALRPQAPHPRLLDRPEAGLPAHDVFGQDHPGDGEPPVPHLRRLPPARRARSRRPHRDATARAGARPDDGAGRTRRSSCSAHLIGDGSFVKRQPLRYASIDEANLRAVTTAALHFGVIAVRDEYPAARCTTLRLPAPFPLTHGKRNPDRRLAGRARPVRTAQPREVRARAGVLPAEEADRAVPAPPVGHRRVRHGEQDRSRWSGLLRLHQPRAGRRRLAAAAAVRHLLPHPPGQEEWLPRRLDAGHQRLRRPAAVPRRDRRARHAR